MSDEYDSDIEEQVPGRTKVIAGIVGAVVLLAAAYALLRVSSPAIRPDQAPPGGHYSFECGLCHALDGSARAVDISR